MILNVCVKLFDFVKNLYERNAGIFELRREP